MLSKNKDLKFSRKISFTSFFLFYSSFFLIIFLLFSVNLSASINLTFFNTTLYEDFGISISYDHIIDTYSFSKKGTNEILTFDSSGICFYKYNVINVSKKIVPINGKLIIPQQLIYSLYNVFFIPIKNKQIYDDWYLEYKKNLEKNDNELKKDQEKKEEEIVKEENKTDKKDNDNKDNNEEKKDIQTDKTDEEKKNQEDKKNEQDNSTPIQKEKETFYSYAQAKMVDFKVISFIVIDAGHGGEDPGAVGSNVYEKDINLKVALKLKNILNSKFPYLSIYLTREKDIKLTLEERVKLANKNLSETKTGIFISLHANANPYSSKKSGIEVYYLDYDIIDEKIKDLVKYENKEVGESLLNNIINRLLNEQLIFESSKLATYCFNNIKNNVKDINASFVKGAPFYVLAYSEMPAILIEMGYITNPNDVKIMLSDNYINLLGYSISLGIEQFIKEYTISEGFKKIQ
ncbi:MAG: N-acetylmuramoyl-L-alanine amidase [Exilispira sp.]|jgi:N-acetylmuramoyl-L-alanine amidase|nr:N-acetylmuramoyl-L-alanine amidase [Exilispira sp.]